MPTRSRRSLLLTIPFALLIGACGSTTPTPTAVPTRSAATEAPSPESSSTTPETSLAAGQTDTDWGRIWDTVPAGFPRFAGSTPADDASPEPASARFAVSGGNPQTIAMWFQDVFERARFSTVGLNGPAEDGSFVLDSAGDGQCRIQTTIAPLGDTAFITVLYGADCPGP
jgi:hypothetical protein